MRIDIDVFHILTWIMAIAIPVLGWVLVKKNRRALPGLLAAFVVFAFSAQNAGLALLDVHYYIPRYLFGGIMFAIGLLIWTQTLNAFCRKD